MNPHINTRNSHVLSIFHRHNVRDIRQTRSGYSGQHALLHSSQTRLGYSGQHVQDILLNNVRDIRQTRSGQQCSRHLSSSQLILLHISVDHAPAEPLDSY